MYYINYASPTIIYKMKQLSLDHLRTLVAVIEHKGYARAGDILGRSQPAISLHIKKLEQLLDRKLFTKQGQRHQVNGDGQQLYQYAKQILAINDQAFQHFEQQHISGQIRLGIPSEFATTVLPGIIGEFSKLYPDVRLEVTSALSRTLLDSDKRRYYDLILALNDNPVSNQDNVLQDDLVWVGAHQHAVSLNPVSLVAAPNGCIYRGRAINGLNTAKLSWRISFTNADLSGITAALQEGLGVTVLARRSVPRDLHIIQHPQLPNLGTVGIQLINQSHRHPHATSRLESFVKDRLTRRVRP